MSLSVCTRYLHTCDVILQFHNLSIYVHILTYINIVSNSVHMFVTRYLYINLPYNRQNFYNESTFIIDSKHLRNVVDTQHPITYSAHRLYPVLKSFDLKMV